MSQNGYGVVIIIILIIVLVKVLVMVIRRPPRGHQAVRLNVDLCALLTDPVILFLWSDQSLSYCCTVIKTVGLRSKV